MSWFEYFAVFAAFFVTHSIPTRPTVRARLVNALGQRGFTALYSCLSLLMLWAVIHAAAKAPFVQLWESAPWHRSVVQICMFGVCLILAFSLARPNPFSFGGARNETFDPLKPGIVRWMRHPILIALALWAALHLLANGDLAHVLLFGVFVAFALFGSSLIDARKKRDLGTKRWQAFLADVKAQPFFNTDFRGAPIALRLCAGLLGYALLLVFHSHVIGVSVAPI